MGLLQTIHCSLNPDFLFIFPAWIKSWNICSDNSYCYNPSTIVILMSKITFKLLLHIISNDKHTQLSFNVWQYDCKSWDILKLQLRMLWLHGHSWIKSSCPQLLRIPEKYEKKTWKFRKQQYRQFLKKPNSS